MNSYEDMRRKRVEENKKQLEGLGILKISKSLLEVSKTEYKQLKNQSCSGERKLLETSELRRSSRMRNPVPTYYDDVVDDPIRSYGSRRLKREPMGREYTGRIPSSEEKDWALKRAELLQSQVALDQPSFVKPMVRSHVSSCFWLGLPMKFCKEHLPNGVITMVLEDEKGDEQESVYISNRAGLSGGWKSFAVDHNLEDGDALVFKLIKQTRFKIYIIRASGSSPVAKDNKDPPPPTLNEATENGSAVQARSAGKRKKRTSSFNSVLCTEILY